MSTSLTKSNSGQVTKLGDVNASVFDSLGGPDAFGRIVAEEFQSIREEKARKRASDVGADTRHQDKMTIQWARLITEIAKGADGQELDIERMSRAEQRELENLMIPLIVQKIQVDDEFCETIIKAIVSANPSAAADFADRLHFQTVQVINV